MEKYGTARQATDGNIIRSMRRECWITKATNRFSTASLLHYTYIACVVVVVVVVVVGGNKPVNNASVQSYHVNATMVTLCTGVE